MQQMRKTQNSRTTWQSEQGTEEEEHVCGLGATEFRRGHAKLETPVGQAQTFAGVRFSRQ